MTRTLSLILLLALVFPVAAQAEKWHTLKNCTLDSDPSNDGDSFFIRHNGKKRYFRLYFVDCPEKDDHIKGRVDDQAKYFGIKKNQAIKVGHEATKFTKGQLNRPFTVYTKYQNAKGGSYMKRYFCFVTTKSGEDLAELLMAHGLARAYGAQASHPKRPGVQSMWNSLRMAEKKAMSKKKGGWRKKW